MNWTSLGAQLASIGLPALGTLLGGPLGGTIGGVVGRSIATALGTPDATPDQVAQTIQADPERARVALAQIEAQTKRDDNDIREMEIAASDRSSARQMQIAAMHDPDTGPAKWMPTVVTLLNYLIATGVIVGVGMGWYREDGIIVGFGLGAVTTAATFWVGSSAGSKRSADTVRQIATSAVSPSPARLAEKALDRDAPRR